MHFLPSFFSPRYEITRHVKIDKFLSFRPIGGVSRGELLVGYQFITLIRSDVFYLCAHAHVKNTTSCTKSLTYCHPTIWSIRNPNLTYSTARNPRYCSNEVTVCPPPGAILSTEPVEKHDGLRNGRGKKRNITDRTNSPR